MSLIKQLWIAVVILITLTFISSFMIGSYSSRAYFVEQLHLKNIDNANVLALSMSQLEKDPILLELMIAAQFDTGHYQRIELITPEGESFLKKVYEGEDKLSVPAWFMRLTPLNVEPGVAQVQDNWFQFGTLYVESHSRFAYQSLWNSTIELFFWFLIVALVCGIAGTLILKMITKPLDHVVEQAEAIGGRRFITSDEPKTLEFGRVVRAMNILSARVSKMLETEGQRLEDLRYKYQHDQITGLANREFFLNIVDEILHREDTASKHALFLIRVTNLMKVNQQLGHQKTDELLRQLANSIETVVDDCLNKYSHASIGRLNGSDFAILLTENDDIEEISQLLLRQLTLLTKRYIDDLILCLPFAAGHFKSGEQRGDVMMRLDSLLATAEQREVTCAEVEQYQHSEPVFHTADEWRSAFGQALKPGLPKLQYYPVVVNGSLLHQEAMVRLNMAGETRTSGYFIAWARRLDLLPELDLAVVQTMLSEMLSTEAAQATAINLSVETLRDTTARIQLISLLQKYAANADKIWLEFDENVVVAELELFKEFGRVIKTIGCKLGLQAGGNRFARIPGLQELGLDYLKIDSSLFRNQALESQDGQSFIRGLCTLGHSIGLLMIAEGVTSETDVQLLQQLGIDGINGPGVKWPQP